MMAFEEVSRAVDGIPFMSPAQGRIVYDHIRRNSVERALELGTAHGVGAAYMAAAVPPTGCVDTVDFAGASFDPPPKYTLELAGVLDRVACIAKHSSYTWWLKEKIEECTDGTGKCVPEYDFIYLDGAKNWTIDGLAVFLAEKLLKPGGWLLLDDLGWTYSDDPERPVSDGITVRHLSTEERSQPHLRSVFDLIVKPHPSFSELRIVDDWWGWAMKDETSVTKSLHVSESQSVSSVIMSQARRMKRRGMRLRRRAQSSQR